MTEEKASELELDNLVSEVLVILKLKGQSQPYAFDITERKELRNIILANLQIENENET